MKAPPTAIARSAFAPRLSRPGPAVPAVLVMMLPPSAVSLLRVLYADCDRGSRRRRQHRPQGSPARRHFFAEVAECLDSGTVRPGLIPMRRSKLSDRD